MENREPGIVARARVRRRRLDMLQRLTRANFRGVVGEADDEWLIVELDYPVPAAVCRLLLFGTDVEVLDPPEAGEAISRMIAALAALYPAGG
ncbi:WYL domain-containing protein [Streptomyces sp. NPDC006140]|uniref:WYL domain-containing protein n=1 Tax=Streptomyces sp. NPDC006140 TaxID=3154579 RepID=UPI0033C7BE9B